VDNELDGRLRRLEAALAEQRDMLAVQSTRLEQTQASVTALVSLLARPEPEGPPLHELLAAMTTALTRGNSIAQQILAAIERLERDGVGRG
jgi:hypothetical protein